MLSFYFIRLSRLKHLTTVHPHRVPAQLKGEMIEKLGLRPIEGEGAVFETAAGIAMESAIYRATIRVNGREASCLLSPSEKDRLDEDEDEESDSEDEEDAAFGFDKVSDGNTHAMGSVKVALKEISSLVIDFSESLKNGSTSMEVVRLLASRASALETPRAVVSFSDGVRCCHRY